MTLIRYQCSVGVSHAMVAAASECQKANTRVGALEDCTQGARTISPTMQGLARVASDLFQRLAREVYPFSCVKGAQEGFNDGVGEALMPDTDARRRACHTGRRPGHGVH